MTRLFDPMQRARDFKTEPNPSVQRVSIERRIETLERQLYSALSILLSEGRSRELVQEVDVLPEIESDDPARIFLVRNEGSDDTLNVGITGPDGEPYWVALSTVPTVGAGTFTLRTQTVLSLPQEPQGVVTDPAGGFYVTYDYDPSKVRRYQSDGTLVWTRIPTNPDEDELMNHIVLSPALDFVYTVGWHFHVDNDLVSHYVPFLDKMATGTGSNTRTVFDAGSGPGEFTSPGAAVTDGTWVWIADANTDWVSKISASTGNFSSRFNGGHFKWPTGLALFGNNLYVLGDNSRNLTIWDKSTSTFISEIKFTHGNGDNQLSDFTEGIAVDVDGNIWVSDTGNHRIVVFDPEFNQIAKIGGYGVGQGQFRFPRQISMDSDGNHAYVADSDNHRIVKISVLERGAPEGVISTIAERTGSSVTLDATSNGTATATCNAGEIAVAGGFVSSGAQTTAYVSERVGTAGWTVSARNSAGVSRTLQCKVYCLSQT